MRRLFIFILTVCPCSLHHNHDFPQFDRMITNPNGADIREKESEYQKNLDNLTGEIPTIKNTN